MPSLDESSDWEGHAMSRRTGAGGSGMNARCHHIGRQQLRRLPSSYFADAPTLSPAGQPTASSHISPHSTIGASPELETAPADDTETGRQGDNASRAQQLRAARTIFGRQH